MLYTKKELDELCKIGLDNLISEAGDQTHLARMLGVTPAVVGAWKLRGQISKKGAFAVIDHPNLSQKFTLKDIRPDLVTSL